MKVSCKAPSAYKKGKVVGNLTLQKIVGYYVNPSSGQRSPIWKCKCSCGGTTKVSLPNLSGNTRSCGCLRNRPRWKLKEAKTPSVPPRSQRNVLYCLWTDINKRCHGTAKTRYMKRGIHVYRSWRRSFSEFRDYILANLGKRPSLKHSLDRIDNDGDYAPGNVRWATWKQQQRNRSSNSKFTFKGVRLCLAEWAERTNIPASSLRYRLTVLGWSMKKAISTPFVSRSNKGT